MADKYIVYELIGSLMNYDWGMKGDKGLVSKFRSVEDSSFVVSDETPYAELWFGMHVKAPCLVKNCQNINIRDFISAKNYKNIPYLLKILSIDKCLSIQVHPDKNIAKELHATNPSIYPDDNHKPELAIALSNFKAMVGIRQINQIVDYLDQVPLLMLQFEESYINDLRDNKNVQASLKQIIINLINMDKSIIKDIIDDIILYSLTDLCQLLAEINEKHPYDPGCLFIYFMNVVEIKPGDSICIKPGVPHAYISGEIIECMANSDNVVRLGLTTKFTDIPTMIKITDFKPSKIDDHTPRKVVRSTIGYSTTLYHTEFDEFSIYQLKVDEYVHNDSELMFIQPFSIIIVTEGAADFTFRRQHCQQTVYARMGKAFLFPYSGFLYSPFEKVNGDIVIYIAQPKIKIY